MFNKNKSFIYSIISYAKLNNKLLPNKAQKSHRQSVLTEKDLQII